MATTDSKLTITSTDLTSNKLSLAVSTPFTTSLGDAITGSSGVQRSSLPAGTTNAALLASTLPYVTKSTGGTYATNMHKNYVYVKNCTATAGQGTIIIFSDGGDANISNSDETVTCEASTCDHAIAVLAKDDWMLIPCPMYSGLIIKNLDASNASLVETMILS